jgi:hypothetical protein
MNALLGALALLLASSTASAVEFTIVTTSGYVRFSVPDDWRVLRMQTKPPVSTAVFQVLNPADDGTPHSTNIVVSLLHEDSEKGQRAAAIIGKPYGPTPAEVRKLNDWTIYTQTPNQQGTKYTVVDAKRSMADVVVHIRFAWPSLPNNPAGYSESMRAAMSALQDSVSGGIGPPPPRDGEIIRRPTQ